jgi:hypothetical protein
MASPARSGHRGRRGSTVQSLRRLDARRFECTYREEQAEQEDVRAKNKHQVVDDLGERKVLATKVRPRMADCLEQELEARNHPIFTSHLPCRKIPWCAL